MITFRPSVSIGLIKSLLRFLAVWFGIIAILSINSAAAFAAEKLAPAGGKQGPEIFVQLGHTDPVYAVAFSPDGKYVLSADDRMGSPNVKLWDLSSGRELRNLEGYSMDVDFVNFSPGGIY